MTGDGLTESSMAGIAVPWKRLLEFSVNTVTLDAGELLVEEGEEAGSVFVMRSGRVDIESGGHLIDTLGPGAVIGELALITGGARMATARASERVIAIEIDPAGFTRLLESEPGVAEKLEEETIRRMDRRAMAQFLFRLVGVVDPQLVDDVIDRIEWVRLEGGDVLFEAGDPPDAVYFIISGRVEAVRSDDGRLTGIELGRNQIVGGVGIFEQQPREVTAQAVRDSVLAKLSLPALLELLTIHPEITLSVAADFARRGRRPERRRERTLSVAATSDIDRRVFCTRLSAALSSDGSAAHVWSKWVDGVLGKPESSNAEYGDPAAVRVAHLLHELELSNTYLVCEADPIVTPWNSRIGRQSDLMVALVTPEHSERDALEMDGFFAAGSSLANRVVVVMHPPGTKRPIGTDKLVERWRPDDILHIRAGSLADIDRLARFVGGRSIGLVLGGGGARGFAYLGVGRAMRELGIPTDMVGGSSIGAPLGVGFCLDVDLDEFDQIVDETFSGSLDYTVPVVSLLKGERITKGINTQLGSWTFEDLWRPFFCVSTNLTKAEVMVHRRGDLARAVRASVAIPGVLPPVAWGEDLLVDAGVLNNLPADIMRRMNPTGTIIAVDVAPQTGPRAKGDPGLSVSGWSALRSKFGASETKYPAISAVLLRSLITGSTQERNRSVARGDMDLYLDLDLRGVPLLDFDSSRSVAKSGYEAAMPRLESWLDSQQSGDST